MKFQNYVEVKKESEYQDIDATFKQAENDINTWFDQLYKGIANTIMNRNKSPEIQDYKNKIYKALKQVAYMVKDENPSAMASVESKIGSIGNLINEVEGIGRSPSLGMGLSGKPVKSLKAVLDDMKGLIMKRMEGLRGSVLKHLGMIGGIQKDVQHIKSRMGSSPISPEEQSKAYDSIEALASGYKQNIPLKLIASDGREIDINPYSKDWKVEVKSKANVNKMFTLVGPNGEKRSVNIGDTDHIWEILDGWGYRGGPVDIKNRHTRRLGATLGGKKTNISQKEAEKVNKQAKNITSKPSFQVRNDPKRPSFKLPEDETDSNIM